MIAAYRTNKGKVRATNQDSLLCAEGKYPLYLVADGMGGHRGGDVSSAMAVECLSGLDLSQTPDEEVLKAIVQRANALIWDRQIKDVSLSGMGTTLTALWEGEDHVLLAHVGDSRAYRYYGGALVQISQDHSLVGELLRSGAITKEMARHYPYRNIITRAIGTDVSLKCDTHRVEKQAGERWLLCSDGLTEYAEPAQLEEAMGMPLEDAANFLMGIAMDGGGRDNITLILLEARA